MEKQKLRNEIEDKFKWDLTLIYKDDNEFLKDLDNIKEEFKKIKNYEDKFMNNADLLLEFMKLNDDLGMRLEKLFSYAHLKQDEDTTNTTYQKYYGLVYNLYSDFIELTSFVVPNFMKYDFDKIEEYIKINPKLKEYEFHFKDLYREKKHILSDDVEKSLSSLSKAFDNSDSVYEILTDSDLTFDTLNKDGKEIELTQSNYISFLNSNDREVRKEAFEKYYKEYKKFKNTISKCLSNFVEAKVSKSKLRKYDSALSGALYSDNIKEEIYNNLIDTVSNNLNPLFKYYNVKKDILNLDELHMYDVYTPVVKDLDKDYTFEDAKDIVLKALKPLGDDYINDLNKAFDERWIDIYNNKGKRSGAYSSGSYLTKPYLLLNYEGKLNDVSTLAHELGHSMHSYYTNKNNTYINSGYSIFVAEVASTVNELLLNNYILNNSNNDEEKLSILNNLIDLYKGTLFRQTMFAEFEKSIYSSVEKGEVLTSDYLSDIYYNLNKKYFGNSVISDDDIRYEWERIPHFYYYFYVYKYATSICASTYIALEILKGNTEVRDKYLKFLTLGNTMYPVDELKSVGINMEDKKVIEDTINYFNKLVDEFEEISKRSR